MRKNFTGLPILPLFPGTPGIPCKEKNTEREREKKVLVEKSNSQPTIQSKMRRERRMQNRLMTVALFGNQNVSYL